MGWDGIHPRVLTELAEVLTKTLSIIYQKSCFTKEVPVGWRFASDIHLQEMLGKKDLGSYRPASLTLVLRKVKGQIILSAIMQYLQHHAGQPGDQNQPAGVWERQLLLNQPDLYPVHG